MQFVIILRVLSSVIIYLLCFFHRCVDGRTRQKGSKKQWQLLNKFQVNVTTNQQISKYSSCEYSKLKILCQWQWLFTSIPSVFFIFYCFMIINIVMTRVLAVYGAVHRLFCCDRCGVWGTCLGLLYPVETTDLPQPSGLHALHQPPQRKVHVKDSAPRVSLTTKKTCLLRTRPEGWMTTGQNAEQCFPCFSW